APPALPRRDRRGVGLRARLARARVRRLRSALHRAPELARARRGAPPARVPPGLRGVPGARGVPLATPPDAATDAEGGRRRAPGVALAPAVARLAILGARRLHLPVVLRREHQALRRRLLGERVLDERVREAAQRAEEHLHGELGRE